MHIILGVLGAIITILILLRRLNEAGIDLGWLNPFAWQRRRQFRKEHDLNPAFKLENPMDVAALYLVAMAKIDGDLTASQKAKILALFEDDFHLNGDESRELLGASVYLIGNGKDVYASPAQVIKRAYAKFTPSQVSALKDMLLKVANTDGQASRAQIAFLQRINHALPSE